MMKIVFKGKSSEYEIQRSCFCVDAFVIKDKIEERDGVDFITSNVDLLEFDDDSFTFEEIVKHFNICDSEDMIIVEDFDMKSNKNNQNQEYDIEHDILKSEKIIHENTKQTSMQFKNLKFFSRIFKNENFLSDFKESKQEVVAIKKHEKLEIFKNLSQEDQEISFVKIEILNYDSNEDSLSFNLDIFPSGMSYKYGILKGSMHIILQGKTYINYEKLRYILSELKYVKNIIIDESFIHFAYENKDYNGINIEYLFKEFHNTIIIKSMSKDFGVAGIRIGYAIMSEDKIRGLLKNGYLWNSSGLSEYFLRLYVRKNFFDEYDKVRREYIQETQTFFRKLSGIKQFKVYPSMANFALVELLDGSSSTDFVAKMLIKYGIYMRTCNDKIGLEGEFIRIASRTLEENDMVLKSICDVFKE